jgi:CheY-like chemotaxis protein
MSHDLRTPLNAVIGFAQLLELEGVGPGQEEAVRQILSGARHLLDLINEVLEITRIETGHLPLSTESVDVADVIASTVSLLQPLAQRRGVTIETHTELGVPEFLLADRSRVGQVLLNFLSNAIKYNREEGTVTVTLTQGAAGHSRVSVTDQGHGIPASKLHLLFTPFERLGAEATAVEGTGLGLAVCKGLIEAMHGTIGAESVPGKGSTFWIELPADPDGVRRTAELRQAAAPENSRPAVSGHVIYIEDNPSNVKLLERLLRQRPNVRLSHFPTGRAGLEAVRVTRPDLLLLDRHLPDMTGDDILVELGRNAQTVAIPVVMLTADAKPAGMPEPGASGLRAYLTKPLNVAEVLRVVDDVLDEVEQRRSS